VQVYNLAWQKLVEILKYFIPPFGYLGASQELEMSLLKIFLLPKYF
jgi:hypothetical protein